MTRQRRRRDAPRCRDRAGRRRAAARTRRSTSCSSASRRRSILRSFDLSVVGRYFPEYEAESAAASGPPERGAGRVSSRPMCEHYVARAAEPFRLDELWPFTERLERYGIAGFGWGAAWLTPDGALAHATATSARSATIRRRGRGRAERDDRSVLVHLRRPSKLSTLQLARHPAVRRSGRPVRVQPQRRPARDRELRDAVPRPGPDPRPGRHRGRGALARGRAGTTTERRRRALRRAPRAVRRPGEPRHARRRRRRRRTTPATRRTRSSRSASAGSGSPRPAIYSLDRSLFRFVAPGATRAPAGPAAAEPSTLDRNGAAVPDVLGSPRRGRRASRSGGRWDAGDRAIATASRRPTGSDAEDAGARPTALLPIGHLVRISLYWLGLTAIDGAVGAVRPEPAQVRRHRVDPLEIGRALFLLSIAASRSSSRSSSSRRSARSATTRQPLGPAQAVHRRRLAARRRVPDRDRDRELVLSRSPRSSTLLAFSTNIARGPFQGYVPDLVAETAGRARERDGRPHADPRQRDRVRARGDRRRSRERRAGDLRGRHRRAGHDAAASCSGSAERAAAEAARGPVVATDRRARRGAPTSSASAATSGCSRRGCSS